MITTIARVAGTSLFTCIVLAAMPAFAQKKTIEIEQSRMQPTIQSSRPIPSWWDVKIQGTGLLEGQLEFTLFNDNRLLSTTTTEDLALSGPQQRVRVMLPPVDDMLPIDQLRVAIRFRGRHETVDLGSQHLLRVAMARSRSFMVLTGMSRLAAKKSPEREAVLHRLDFKSLAPVELDEEVVTVQNSLEPNDFPQEPLAYCSYEMVILFGDEFRQLKKQYLDALLAWVRAGGSLYLEPTGVLDNHHVDFLRKLTSSDPRGLVIQPDSHGCLIPGTIFEEERILLVSNSLGRAVIRVEEEQSDADFGAPRWRQVAAFLWRFHSDQVQMIGTLTSHRLGALLPYGWSPSFDGNGRINQSPQPANVAVPPGAAMPNLAPPGAPNAWAGQQAMPNGWLNRKLRTSTVELVNRLMPDGVQMVPLWVLSVILVSFVAWIGPVDYIALGRLKARKYTWLTFPLATIFVTAFTVWITNRYMSSAETRRALTIRDIGDDGSIVRTNRFELLFVASSRPATTDVRKGVFTPLETSSSMNDDVNMYGAPVPPMAYRQRGNVYGNMAAGSSGSRSPARLEGRIPTEFTATQDMAKWKPQLNRVFSIPGTGDDTAVDWNALTEAISANDIFKTHSIPTELTVRVQASFGKNALVACLGQNGRWAYDNGAGWASVNGQEIQQRLPSQYYMGDEADYNASAQLPPEIQQQPHLFRWMYQHSVAIPYGLFVLISSTGPTGGPQLTDLPILDASRPNQVLLIVVVPHGMDFVAYRKLLNLAEAGKPQP